MSLIFECRAQQANDWDDERNQNNRKIRESKLAPGGAFPVKTAHVSQC
jgi:hypothetical protein